MATQKFICPAISVVIPLYNVEKYIAECLDSVLAQTFQDFEVIVVDDCSTDNSVAIVESYAEKFGGRLKLPRMKKNTGGAGLPCNKGIELARGEYIYFIDPDDAITPTALEELYTAAKKFDADVIHCEKWYLVPDRFWYDTEIKKRIKPSSHPAGEKIFITQPTFLTDDLEQRVMDFSKAWLAWGMWNQLIRRDFIVKNKITFGNFITQDMIFTICEICCAKKYLVVPNVVYFYRKREGSATTEQLNIARIINKRVKAVKRGILHLDKFLNGIDFYSRRPDLKYSLFNVFAQEILGHLNEIYAQIPVYALNEI